MRDKIKRSLFALLLPLRSNHNQIVIGLAIAGVILVFVVATFKMWILPLLALWLFTSPWHHEFGKQLKADEAEAVVPEFDWTEPAFQELYAVLREGAAMLNAYKPNDFFDIVRQPATATRCGITVVKARCLKCKRGQSDPDDLLFYQRYIQDRIIEHIRRNRVENVPFTSVDGETPIFVIDKVDDDHDHLLIDLLVVDTMEKVRITRNFFTHAQTTSGSSVPDDEDFG